MAKKQKNYETRIYKVDEGTAVEIKFKKDVTPKCSVCNHVHKNYFGMCNCYKRTETEKATGEVYKVFCGCTKK